MKQNKTISTLQSLAIDPKKARKVLGGCGDSSVQEGAMNGDSGGPMT